MSTVQKIIQIILYVLIFSIFLIFAMYNNQQTASVRFLNWQTVNMPVWILVFISVIIGLALGLILTTGLIITAHKEKRRHHKENIKTKAELNRMRNVSIDEDLTAEKKQTNDKPVDKDKE